jgi:redox-sensing transcriptional repressor
MILANQSDKIPRATLKRLPLYYRFVNTLKSKGIDRVNSKGNQRRIEYRFCNYSS